MIFRNHTRWIFPLLTVFALAFSFWSFTGAETPVATATTDPHAGHNHGAPEADLDDLFADEADHDEDHHGHAEAKVDEHEGHNHGPDEGDCPAHGIPEIEDALCQPQLMDGLQPGQGLKVRLATADAAERVGITASLPLASLDRGAILPGQVVFNRNKLARLSTLVPGVVKTVHAELGARVVAGQVLAEIATPEIASLRASLQAAQSRADLTEGVYLREKDLLARGIS